MTNDIELTINRLKQDTNNNPDINIRKKIIHKKRTYIIFNEPVASTSSISDYIIKSLDNLKKEKDLFNNIKNNIYNGKVKVVNDYDSMCYYLNSGFTIILVEKHSEALVFETKANINRSIDTPTMENSIRSPKDAFIENYQANMGLIRKRIKTNNLWVKELYLGKQTMTKIGIIYINTIAKEELVSKIETKLKEINIDGIITSGEIKNLIQKENNSLFPTIISTERPDIVCEALLQGKVAILVENAPYVLIIPGLFIDYFIAPEDKYSKSLNISFTRIIRYIAFFISILTPAIYTALTTYNQEAIPTELLISFATQRNGVPFPAFFEAFIMILGFELLRESDLRTPSTGGSSISIVGALILGEAAVSAGIVSSIMIIIIALTAISSYIFTEIEMIKSLRYYRCLFMIGASFLGLIGVLATFIIFLTNITNKKVFGIPYLTPIVPTNKIGLKDAVIKSNIKNNDKRPSYLSNNRIKER